MRETVRALPTGPLVGRDFELTVLERTMDGLREGRGVIVSVIGEAGIGKTRLVNEVRSEYADVIRFIEGRAVSYAQSFPYSPIRDLLRDWLRVGASTPETRVRLELKAQLAELFGDEADDAYSFLANLLGLTLEPDEAEKIRELNRESVQHQTIEVFAELLYRLSEEQPLCVVLEDLHWADESTLELLEETLRVTEEAAIGLVFLYRTEREHRSWRLGERARQLHPHRYREIELRPLPTRRVEGARRPHRRRRAARGRLRPARRARRRQPVLPRGGAARPRRARRADPLERRLEAGRRRRTTSRFPRSSRERSRRGSTGSIRTPARWSAWPR